jgi:hypothetical protein
MGSKYHAEFVQKLATRKIRVGVTHSCICKIPDHFATTGQTDLNVGQYSAYQKFYLSLNMKNIHGVNMHIHCNNMIHT